MSRQELHDLLAQLKQERDSSDLVDNEHKMRLEEIIESLEQQKLYPDTFDQFSVLSDQIQTLFDDLESEHPSIRALLTAMGQLLHNFRA